MYSKTELTAKAHIELIEIAKSMGISKATRLDAQELVYKILDYQASNPTPQAAQQHVGDDQPRKRQHMKPKMLAESTMKTPELHKKANKKVENKREVSDIAGNGIPNLNIEMPTVPEVPEVLSPMGRPFFRSLAPEGVEKSEENEEPAAVEQQPAKKKRGRPKKNTPTPP